MESREPNSIVKPIHSKSMPVILRDIEEWNAWLTLPIEDAKATARYAIHIVAKGAKGD